MKKQDDGKKTEYTRICAGESNILTELSELTRYKDLIALFVKRDFVIRYKQTILGPLWIILQPFITSLIYLFVFGGIAKISTDGVPGILFYISGNALWSFFSSTLGSNANTFTGNAYLFGKVYFPRLTVPIANTVTSALKFLIEICLFACFYIWFAFHGQVNGSILAFPVTILILIHLGALGIGCGIILSSMTTKYRDLSILVGFGLSLWMYGSPIVYPLSGVTNPIMRTVILFNPVTAPAELFRELLFGTGTLVPWSFAFSWIVTFITLFIGIRLFSNVEKTFIDTV